MTPQEVTELVVRISNTWPNSDMSDITTEAWAEVLTPIDAGAARRALVTLRKSHDFMPAPTRLEELTSGSVDPSRSIMERNARRAEGRFDCRRCRDVGVYEVEPGYFTTCDHGSGVA